MDSYCDSEEVHTGQWSRVAPPLETSETVPAGAWEICSPGRQEADTPLTSHLTKVLHVTVAV